ncbi:MAG: hypothetical protein HY372_04175 [Candidatus Andersenbacteria bacterium]|nr:hypothetical protein [Candidatus Andersenbacteria bacterium]
MIVLNFISELDQTIDWAQTTGGLSFLTFQDLAQNIADFLLSLVSMVALAVFVWGGLTYITSLGDESRSAKAKRTIAYAVAGMMVAGLAFLIQVTVEAVGEFGLGRFIGVGGVIDVIVSRLLAFIRVLLAPAGVFAFAALIYGGYMYITSGGDESRASLAKRVILYALLGLIVIGLSGIIVNIVIEVLP